MDLTYENQFRNHKLYMQDIPFFYSQNDSLQQNLAKYVSSFENPGEFPLHQSESMKLSGKLEKKTGCFQTVLVDRFSWHDNHFLS
jgi:hypothetical protein